MILSGYNYDRVGPHLNFFDIHSQTYKKQYLNEQSITIKKLPDRYCIGIYDLSTLSYLPCPTKSKLSPISKINNCDICYKKIGFNPAFYNAKKISPQQLKYNEKPHSVYLAYFSQSHVKVGIASEKRIFTRLLEQGARAAYILKTFQTAYLARKLEAKLCYGNYGILERMTSEQKLKILCENKYSPADAKNRLNEVLRNIEITPESNFLEFSNKYFYDNNYDISDLNFTPNADYLSGKTLGMIGDTVILKQENNFFAFSIKKFISHEIEVKYGNDFLRYRLSPKQISFW